MPIITLASTKGGSTKTTSAITLATTIAQEDPELRVTVVDCDPEAYLSRWYFLSEENGVLPSNIKLVQETQDQNIADVLSAAEEEADIVIVDPEGKATMLLRDAILFSDLTLIPLQPSPMDALAIPNIVEVIQKTARSRRHTVVIDHHAMFTRTKAGMQPSKEQKDIIKGCKENDIPLMTTELFEREVFKGYASVGGTLYSRRDDALQRLAGYQERVDEWNQDNIERLAGRMEQLSDKAKTDLKAEKAAVKKQMAAEKSLVDQLEKAIENSEGVKDEVLDLLRAAVEKRSAA